MKTCPRCGNRLNPVTGNCMTHDSWIPWERVPAALIEGWRWI